jgi:hypothetical protein
MNYQNIIQSIILNLQEIDFESKQLALRQLASAFDLLNAIAEDIYNSEDTKAEMCKHPEEHRSYLRGTGKVEFQCLQCNQHIELKKEE